MDIRHEAAAALAHEVKNPLSLIKMNVEQIRGSIDREFEENFKIIEREIEKINDLVTGLGRNIAPIGVKGLINGIISEYDISLKDKDIDFSVTGGEGIYVTGNIDKLNILFFNLIKNSVEAIDKKGEINIDISETDDLAIIDISDTGGGISEKIMDKIGQPYNTGKEGGTGLGLAICTSIVNEHKGSMAFENTEKGCKAEVKLKK